MKICAVICELNPFHNGHEYIFREARRKSGCDAVLALMSGHFVQRATPAVIDEYARARCALGCGADIVLELPVIYAVAAAEKFARGAIDILNSIPSVTSLAMGTESDNRDLIVTLAEIQAAEGADFKRIMRAALDEGSSYPQALTEATAAEATKYGYDRSEVRHSLTKPNNILAIAYKKALIRSRSTTDFVPVVRMGEEGSSELSGRFSSASAIRENIDGDTIGETMPAFAYAVLKKALNCNRVSSEIFGALTLAALRTADLRTIGDTPDCAEGMERKIKSAAENAVDYEDFLTNMNTVRFTRGRVARIGVQTLLGIDKTMQNCGYNFARLLGVRKDMLELLGQLPRTIITNKKSETHIPSDMRDIYETEKKASGIYAVITRRRGNFFYKKLEKV